jgi:hypothetical protein
VRLFIPREVRFGHALTKPHDLDPASGKKPIRERALPNPTWPTEVQAEAIIAAPGETEPRIAQIEREEAREGAFAVGTNGAKILVIATDDVVVVIVRRGVTV